MPWRPHGRARVNPVSPEGFSTCQRCGFLYNLVDLPFQYEWRGNQLMSTGFRVCTWTCMDVPADFLRPIILPADPEPLWQPRPEPYTADEAGSYTPPQPTNAWELEDGSGAWELEDGSGFWELESP